MIRLFVALELPDAVKAALIAGMGGVAGARWQRDDQLHCTLRYIGEVDRHTAQDIAAALGRVNVRPFSAELGEAGLFEHRGRVDSLWVGVRPAERLATLAKAVNAALVGVGLAPETRAFVPHITVARGRGMLGVTAWPQAPIPRVAWPVSGFALWDSEPGPDGSDYQVLARWP